MRERNAEMRNTDGELHDGWIELITSEHLSNSTPRYERQPDVLPNEAIGNMQHHQRIILANTNTKTKYE